MSSHNDPVKPASFSLADPEPAPAPEVTARAAPSNWVMPTLAALVVLALIVVFWLPGRFDGAGTEDTPAEVGQTTEAAADTRPKSTPSKPKERGEEASPWSDAQLAKLRKEAQDVLGILLDVQFQLQELGVEQWAAQTFEAAKALAKEGDLQYRDREFVQAKASYDKALSAMEALVEAAPQALQENLDAAHQAIEDGQQNAALQALAIAEVIDPDSTVLATLKHRAQTLEQLLPLLEQAGEAEASSDLAGAESLLQEAAKLDPDHQKVQSELARVASAHTLQRFNRAMSKGYTALDEGQFSSAKKYFRSAAKLVPGSAEASSALQDLDAAQTSAKLGQLQTKGQKFEASEQWQQAVETYNKALAIDANLLFAQQGLKRSRSRAQLDKQFRAAIDTPARLSDKTVANATAQLVRQAANIKPMGPVLEQQLSTLGVLLQRAGAKIRLTLRSDGLTEVTLRKVSRLGQFKEKVLTIRPGTYTVIGSRNGYRDVRRSFTAEYDTGAMEVLIVCTEAI